MALLGAGTNSGATAWRTVAACSATGAVGGAALTTVAAMWSGGFGVSRAALMLTAALEGVKLVATLTGSEPAVQTLTGRGSKPRRSQRPRPRDLFKLAIFLPACAVAYFILIILLGAPITHQHEDTFLLACLLTVLTVFPSCFYSGVDTTISILTGTKWFTGDKILEMLQQNILLTLLGAWCGGVVIPLDWDRSWQVWPVPCYIGALIGYTVSQLLTLVKLVPFITKRLARKTKY